MRVLSGILIALSVAASAQTPEPSLRATSSEVLLDIVVRDKHADIVHNLKAQEIQVFEDGVPQQLRHFEFIDGHKPDQAAGEPAPSAPSTVFAPSTIARHLEPTVNELRDISVVSVVIGNLDPRGRKEAIDRLRDFIKSEMRPSIYVGVFGLGFGTLKVVQPYTNDVERISAALDHLSHAAMIGQLTASNQLSLPDTDFGSPLNGAAGTASDPNGPSGPSGPVTVGAGALAAELAALMDTSWITEMHDVYADSRNYLTPLHDFVQAQATIPGRKVVLLFSAGMPVQSDTVELLHGVISAANRSNVSIYAVDTRGVTTQSHLDEARRTLKAAVQASREQQLAKVNGTDLLVTPTQAFAQEMGEDTIHSDTNGNLAELADGTGGELLPDSMDLRGPLHRAIEDVRTHYELTYSPTNGGTDGKFRRIEIKVSRPNVRVFARNGYYAVPNVNGREVYPFEMATLKALNTSPLLHQFEMRATALQFRAEAERTQFEFAFQTPIRNLAVAKDGRWLKVHISVTALIKNERGQVVEKIGRDIPYEVPGETRGEFQRGVVSFTTPFQLPPGRYTMETAAVDRQSMRASVSRSTIEVTQPSDFTMSDVVGARHVDPIQGRANGFDPLQARGGKVTPELSDSLSPDVVGNVKFYAIAYPPAPVDAPCDAIVEVWRDEHLVMRSPASEVPLDESGAASILASVATGNLRSGHYQAHVVFEYKGQTVTKTVPFTVPAGS